MEKREKKQHPQIKKPFDIILIYLSYNGINPWRIE